MTKEQFENIQDRLNEICDSLTDFSDEVRSESLRDDDLNDEFDYFKKCLRNSINELIEANSACNEISYNWNDDEDDD